MENKLEGKVFGYLKVIRGLDITRKNFGRWECLCECGKILEVHTNQLINANKKSCGCKRYARKHGGTNTLLYKKWLSMINRCRYKKMKSYKNYGGRGIVVCDEWLNDFVSFKEWSLANGYNDSLTIDRIDHNGNYEPSNCRWVDWYVQANNKRNNRIIEYNGEHRTMAEWARIFGIEYSTLQKRLDYSKMTMDEIANTPTKNNKVGINNIYYHKKSNAYRVQKKVNGKSKHYGSFKTIEEAMEKIKQIKESE